LVDYAERQSFLNGGRRADADDFPAKSGLAHGERKRTANEPDADNRYRFHGATVFTSVRF